MIPSWLAGSPRIADDSCATDRPGPVTEVMTRFPPWPLALAACTHWTTTPSYGPQREIARRLLGSPPVEVVSSSNIAGGFSTFSESSSWRHDSTTLRGGGLVGSHDSATRTHCVQQAQIDYVQPVTYETHATHRVYDLAGSIALGVAGLAIVMAANAMYNSDERFYEMDPTFFAKPSTPTLAYGIGGAAAVGAGAWLVYSLTALPKGSPPSVAPTQREWTETTFVEASGCGLVPADR
jgi:hypothetical protein